MLIFFLLVSNVEAAELLIKAKPHWKDEFSVYEVNKMDTPTRQQYENRTQVGDIVVVKPNGSAWGKEEKLPNYIVVKVPDLTVKEALKYQEPLPVITGTRPDGLPEFYLKRQRKYTIDKTIVNQAKLSNLSVVQMNKTAMLSDLKVKY